MVIVSPLRIGLWDPFQMAELHGGNKWGVILTTYVRPGMILQVDLYDSEVDHFS